MWILQLILLLCTVDYAESFLNIYTSRSFIPSYARRLDKLSKNSFSLHVSLPEEYLEDTETRGATIGIDDTHEQIDLLYDSDCPICMMEVEFLIKRDINHMIKFTDLQSPDYDPVEHGNIKFKDGMRKIRAVLPNGEVVVGVDVFQETYDAIGLGWIFALTKIPLLHDVADRVYDLWAENRLRLTGRPDMANQLRERSSKLRVQELEECDTDACGLDFSDLDDE